MKLLLERGINLLGIVLSYLFSRISGKAFHRGNPVAVGIEPTNHCNLRCPECPAGMKQLTREKGFMHPDLFNTIIGQLLPSLSYITLYFQGEPYMNTHLFDFIAFARSKKIYVATSTNGHFLDEVSVRRTIESGLNRLIISLDGADQESYGLYRKGGDFSKVTEGIRLLASEKKRLKIRDPEIVLQCLVFRSNEHRLGEIKKLGKDLGADKITFKTAQFYDYENGNPLMPETSRYSRYSQNKRAPVSNLKTDHQKSNTEKSDLFQILTSSDPQVSISPRYRVRNSMPDSCFRMWSSCVITWDGKVVPCCFDKDSLHVMGDLTRQKFGEIWRGQTYHDFRSELLRSRKSIGICRNCDQTF